MLRRKLRRGGGSPIPINSWALPLVHPDLKEVVPLAPRPIIKQDGGQTRSDCEAHATRRWLNQFHREHPHLPVIVVEDAWPPTPCLKDLPRGRHFIIEVGQATRAFLGRHLPGEAGQMRTLTWIDPATDIHHRYGSAMPHARQSHADELVNVLEYWEIHPDHTVQHFSWITDFLLTPATVWDVMRGGRARWKIKTDLPPP